jgi:excisionase family DNA binding protein
MDFLTVEDVCQILKAHSNTVYKMCREGTLPAVKIGKEWRIDRERLAKFMEGGTPPQKFGAYQGLIQHSLRSGHMLGVFANEKDILDFELTYFMEARGSGYKLFKACWWQHPDDVRRHMTEAGLPVEEMEADGSLVIRDLLQLFVHHGARRAAEAWAEEARDASQTGYKGLVGSGSKHFECCNSHHTLLEFENALDKISKKFSVTSVCSYFLDMNTPTVLTRLVDLILVHDNFFIQTDDTEILANVDYSLVHPGRKRA